VAALFVAAVLRLVSMATTAAAANSCVTDVPGRGVDGGEKEVKVGKEGKEKVGGNGEGKRGEEENEEEDWVAGECYLLEVAFWMLPLEGQISDFFAPVPAAIVLLLRNHEIIPTLRHEWGGQGEGIAEMVEKQEVMDKRELGTQNSLLFTRPAQGVRRPVPARPDVDGYTEVFL